MLKNAPHTIAELTSDIWQHDYLDKKRMAHEGLLSKVLAKCW